MVAASEFMEWWFGWDCPVPVPSDTVVGDNMMEENKIDVAVHADIRNELRKLYMDNYVPTFERT